MRSVIALACLLAACADPIDWMPVDGPDGETVYINPSSIVALRGQKDIPKGLYHSSIKCLLQTSDGKQIPLTSDCSAIVARTRK